MPRTLSTVAQHAIFGPETGEVFLILLTISHPDLGAANPLRFVNNMTTIVSRGNTFLPYAFEITLPEEREDQMPQVLLRIDNIDKLIVTSLRSLTSRPTITMEVVVASTPDTVEAGPFNFDLKSAEYNAVFVQGELGFEPILIEPFPSDNFTPSTFRGLF